MQKHSVELSGNAELGENYVLLFHIQVISV